jgi:hypothetical protein
MPGLNQQPVENLFWIASSKNLDNAGPIEWKNEWTRSASFEVVVAGRQIKCLYPSFRPTLDNAFACCSVLLQDYLVVVQKCVGMDVIEPWLLFAHDNPSPFEIPTIDGRKLFIIRTASLDVSGASVHVELQEHIAYGHFHVARNSRSVDADCQFIEI